MVCARTIDWYIASKKQDEVAAKLEGMLTERRLVLFPSKESYSEQIPIGVDSPNSEFTPAHLSASCRAAMLSRP